ncbi:MAG: S-layer homology domain-containing protein, partial [Dehalococcoidia bacterium]
DFCDTGFSTIATFADVAKSHWAWKYIEGLYRSGVTGGCSASPLMYCPGNSVTRAQMAIFLLRGIEGMGYTPPPATGIFADVPNDWTADWIEAFYNLGITSGCGTSPLRYCPNNYLTRTQMAVFLVRAKHGSSFVPSAATGIFSDVTLDGFFDGFIEQLYNDSITLGCATSPLRYCPNGLVSRAEMAAFLTRTFDLPLP